MACIKMTVASLAAEELLVNWWIWLNCSLRGQVYMSMGVFAVCNSLSKYAIDCSHSAHGILCCFYNGSLCVSAACMQDG